MYARECGLEDVKTYQSTLLGINSRARSATATATVPWNEDLWFPCSGFLRDRCRWVQRRLVVCFDSVVEAHCRYEIEGERKRMVGAHMN